MVSMVWENASWEEFTHALCVRFGPFDYEDFDKALAKLQVTTDGDG